MPKKTISLCLKKLWGHNVFSNSLLRKPPIPPSLYLQLLKIDTNGEFLFRKKNNSYNHGSTSVQESFININFDKAQIKLRLTLFVCWVKRFSFQEFLFQCICMYRSLNPHLLRGWAPQNLVTGWALLSWSYLAHCGTIFLKSSDWAIN